MKFFCILDCKSTCFTPIPGNRRWASSIYSGQSATSFEVTHMTRKQALLVIRWTVKHIWVAIKSAFATFCFSSSPIFDRLRGIKILSKLRRFLLRWVTLLCLKTSLSVSAKISATTAPYSLQYLITSTASTWSSIHVSSACLLYCLVTLHNLCNEQSPLGISER